MGITDTIDYRIHIMDLWLHLVRHIDNTSNFDDYHVKVCILTRDDCVCENSSNLHNVISHKTDGINLLN